MSKLSSLVTRSWLLVFATLTSRVITIQGETDNKPNESLNSRLESLEGQVLSPSVPSKDLPPPEPSIISHGSRVPPRSSLHPDTAPNLPAPILQNLATLDLPRNHRPVSSHLTDQSDEHQTIFSQADVDDPSHHLSQPVHSMYQSAPILGIIDSLPSEVDVDKDVNAITDDADYFYLDPLTTDEGRNAHFSILPATENYPVIDVGKLFSAGAVTGGTKASHFKKPKSDESVSSGIGEDPGDLGLIMVGAPPEDESAQTVDQDTVFFPVIDPDDQSIEEERLSFGVNQENDPEKRFMRGFVGTDKRFMRGFVGPDKRFMRGFVGPNKKFMRGFVGLDKRFMRGFVGADKRFMRGFVGPDKKFMRGFIGPDKKFMRGFVGQDKKFMRGFVGLDKRFMRGFVGPDKRFMRGFVGPEKRFMRGFNFRDKKFQFKGQNFGTGQAQRNLVKRGVKEESTAQHTKTGANNSIVRITETGMTRSAQHEKTNPHTTRISSLEGTDVFSFRQKDASTSRMNPENDNFEITRYKVLYDNLDKIKLPDQSKGVLDSRKSDSRIILLPNGQDPDKSDNGKSNNADEVMQFGVDDNDIFDDKRFMRGFIGEKRLSPGSSEKEIDWDGTGGEFNAVSVFESAGLTNNTGVLPETQLDVKDLALAHDLSNEKEIVKTEVKRFMKGLIKKDNADRTTSSDKRFMRGFVKKLHGDELNYFKTRVMSSMKLRGNTGKENLKRNNDGLELGKESVSGDIQTSDKRFMRGLVKKDDNIHLASGDKRFMRGLIKKEGTDFETSNAKRFMRGLVKKERNDYTANEDKRFMRGLVKKQDNYLEPGDKRFMRGLIKKDDIDYKENSDKRFMRGLVKKENNKYVARDEKRFMRGLVKK